MFLDKDESNNWLNEVREGRKNGSSQPGDIFLETLGGVGEDQQQQATSTATEATATESKGEKETTALTTSTAKKSSRAEAIELCDLPDELLVKIFSYLGFSDWITVRRLSRQFKYFVEPFFFEERWNLPIEESSSFYSVLFKNVSEVNIADAGSQALVANYRFNHGFFSKASKFSSAPISRPQYGKLILTKFFGQLFNFNQPETSLIALLDKPLLVIKLLNSAVTELMTASKDFLEQQLDRANAELYSGLASICYAIQHLHSLSGQKEIAGNAVLERPFQQIYDSILEQQRQFFKEEECNYMLELFLCSGNHTELEKIFNECIEKENGDQCWQARSKREWIESALNYGNPDALKFVLGLIKEHDKKKSSQGIADKDKTNAEIIFEYYDKAKKRLDRRTPISHLIKEFLKEINNFPHIGRSQLGENDKNVFSLAHKQLSYHRKLSMLKYLFLEEDSFQEYFRKPINNDKYKVYDMRDYFIAAIEGRSTAAIDILLESEVAYCRSNSIDISVDLSGLVKVLENWIERQRKDRLIYDVQMRSTYDYTIKKLQEQIELNPSKEMEKPNRCTSM